MEKLSPTTEAILQDRFGCDNLIALATTNGTIPYVRAVNAYYEAGAFYGITCAASDKMTQIRENPTVAVCGDWFTGHGIGENLGWIRESAHLDLADKLRTVFAEWYDNGHVDENDQNTVILRIRLTDGILYHHGTRYDIDFTEVNLNQR